MFCVCSSAILYHPEYLDITDQVDPYKCGHCGKCFFELRSYPKYLQQELCYQRTPFLDLYSVLRFSIEVMQLEVLFKFLEKQFNVPAQFVQKCYLFPAYLKIIGNELVHTSFIISVSDLAKT